MKDKRPVNLKLTAIHFPMTAIVSILHRLSGLLLFVLIPVFLYVFTALMASPPRFNAWVACFSTYASVRFIIWLLVAAMTYHLIAGIRHLLMDVGVAESLVGGRMAARLVLLIWVIVAIVLGMTIWLRLF
ncbi:MAG: succinate dehydrogenase, cytochrome b556 subunit [Pseudomonadota bacterium]